MIGWFVLADDRSGALEVAGALAGHLGPVPVVTHARLAAAGPPDASAVVVDLASRHLSAGEAAARVAGCASVVARRRLHKIDSTLRGRWADELVAVGGRVLVVPALPGLGRTCTGGVVHVDGRPLQLDDPRHGPVEARPATLLRTAGASVVVELSGVGELATWLADPSAAAFAVCDASTDADLAAIGALWAAAAGVTLAGTSASLAAAAGAAAGPDPAGPDGRGAAAGLAVAGAAAGLATAVAAAGLTGAGFDGPGDTVGVAEAAAATGSTAAGGATGSATAEAAAGTTPTGAASGPAEPAGAVARRPLPRPALVAVGSLHPVARAQLVALRAAQLAGVEVVATAHVDGPVDAAAAERASAELAGDVLRRLAGQAVATLVIVGGDTAGAVLGDHPMIAGGTVAAGIPWAHRADGTGPLVVTKAGGFGNPDTLAELLAGRHGSEA